MDKNELDELQERYNYLVKRYMSLLEKKEELCQAGEDYLLEEELLSDWIAEYIKRLHKDLEP